MTRLAAATLPLILSLACLQTSCMPQDPEHTLRQVRDGRLRVGVSAAPPWIETENMPPSGIEARLVEDLAHSLGAQIVWERDGAEDLYHRLEKFEIDLVLAGIENTTPWKSRVALTRPYLTLKTEDGPEKHVWALPPGENAWLLAVERFLDKQKARARQLYESTG